MSTRAAREERKAIQRVAAGIESAMRARAEHLGQGVDIDDIESALEAKMEREMHHEPGAATLTIGLSSSDFKLALANYIVRGTAAVTELVTHHNGRKVRIVCDGDPACFRVWLDGRVEYL